MSKFYAQWRRPQRKERPWKIHPIWRGIGCLMLIIIPFFAYMIGDWAVQENFQQQWVAIPYDMLGPQGLPVENLYVKLAAAAVVSVILFAGYTLIYGVIYSLMGPSRYGPMDVPPMKRKPAPQRRKGGR